MPITMRVYSHAYGPSCSVGPEVVELQRCLIAMGHLSPDVIKGPRRDTALETRADKLMGHGHGDEAGTFGSQTRDAIITFQFKAVHVHNRATSDTLGEFGCDTHQALQKELEDRRKGKRVPKVPAGGSVFTGVGQALTHAHGTSGGGGGIGGGSGIGAGSNGDGDDGAGSGAGSSHGGDRPDRRVTQFMWFHDMSEAPSISGSQTVEIESGTDHLLKATIVVVGDRT